MPVRPYTAHNAEVVRKWRLAHKDHVKQYNKEYAQRTRATAEGRGRKLWDTARTRALRKGVVFELTPEWVIQLCQQGVCQVTGFPLDFSTSGGRHKYAPSIDRKDPDKGYTVDNSQMVVWIYNVAKNAYTHGDLVILSKAILAMEPS